MESLSNSQLAELFREHFVSEEGVENFISNNNFLN